MGAFSPIPLSMFEWFLTFSRRQTLRVMAGDSYAPTPSLISRRRDFPGAPPGSFYPSQQVLSCFLDIDRGVYVSVVVGSASRTVPFTDRQRQLIQQMPTRRTQFRRRKEPIQRKIDSSVPPNLVFQFAIYFPERRIRDVFGKPAWRD